MAQHTIHGAAGQTAAATVRAGDQVVISLPENPSTGYRWRLTSYNSRHVVPSGDEYEPRTPPQPGSDGVRLIRLQVVAPGHATTVLRLQRPWQPHPPPGPEFTLIMSIEG